MSEFKINPGKATVKGNLFKGDLITVLDNLVSVNVATGTDNLSNTTGFAWNAVGETLTSSTEQAFNGTRSLKCVTTGTSSQGVRTSSIDITPNLTYTYQVRVYAPLGASMKAVIGGRTSADASVGTTETNFTGTGTWQTLTISRPMGSTEVKARVHVVVNEAVARTFYIDNVILIQGTSIPPGVTIDPVTGDVLVCSNNNASVILNSAPDFFKVKYK